MIYVSRKGVKWYLHTRKVTLPRNKIEATSYYFKKEPDEHYFEGDLPVKYKVIETNGAPFVKKI